MSWDILPKSNLQYFLTKLKGIFDNKVDKEAGKGLFSGSYNDLTNKPTIPAAQVNSDWNASSGVAQILNKPTIPAAQVNSDWNASSGVAAILNKPSSMPASDVYAWAKAATKPSYTANEVGALASNGTAAKATADADGNTISSTYMKKGVDYVTAGKKANTTLGYKATAEGQNTTASGATSHAEGNNTTASASNAHAEGSYTTASKLHAHAEGSQTTASGAESHAEGLSTTASGDYSHSEGLSTTASGNASHTEGSLTEAAGGHAHAEGMGTKASSHDQHVEGKYNVEDTNGTYVHIIGGGTSDNARKNIFTVDWNGVVRDGTANRLMPYKAVSEAEYAALSQAEKTNGTAYFRYEATGIMRQIQDDGSATSLTSGALPTGQTITSYLNSNLVEGDITVSSGFTLEHKKAKKYMRVVSIEYRGGITPSSTGWFTIGNIANSAMRPVNQFDIFAVDNNSSTSALGCQVRITTDGDIKVYSYEANKYLRPYILATYIV